MNIGKSNPRKLAHEFMSIRLSQNRSVLIKIPRKQFNMVWGGTTGKLNLGRLFVFKINSLEKL
jgi:hypothetical protein